MTAAVATNPLIAARQDPTRAYSGIPLAEDIEGLVQGIRDGSWVETGLGIVGTGLDALSFVVDPLGSLAASGVGWLIEHVRPLREALDVLAGDAAQISAFATTWANVSRATAADAARLRTEVDGLSSWTGQAADAYRGYTSTHIEVLGLTSRAADGLSVAVNGAGMLVGTVRTIIRDLIAQFVGRLIAWAIEAIVTAGAALPVVAEQAAVAVEAFSVRLANFLRKLATSLRRLGELITKLKAIVAELRARLRRPAPSREEGKRGACFVPGTPVLTPTGPRPIESLRVGDLVLAYDVEAATSCPQPVTATFARDVPAVLDLTIAGATITCSPEHPFWLAYEQQWRPAEELVPGTALLTAGGDLVKVDAVRERPPTEVRVRVHNITVAGLATYFVADGVLVHNKPMETDPEPLRVAKSEADLKLRDMRERITDARQRVKDSDLEPAQKKVLQKKLDDIERQLEDLQDNVTGADSPETVSAYDGWRDSIGDDIAEVERDTPKRADPTPADTPNTETPDGQTADDGSPAPNKPVKLEDINPTDQKDWPSGWNGGRNKEPIPGISAKERADDLPSWASGAVPRVGESGEQFARRVMGYRYPGVNESMIPKGANTDWSRLQKYARGYRDPQ